MRFTLTIVTVATFFAITAAAASAPSSMKRADLDGIDPAVEIDLAPICECPCCHSTGGKLFCC
ncbi:hypothetical protein GALMADRAFT_144013 [Galerina marginata CBS 339.88]|uniref:Uncharacterized protein n=1 Tax=Galerina marginata (strain CBS 339.88) TaxID=685588 RepID=A0A067SUD8_GALM3|nr:hypothetical protein GALMADRAFT_144013 [Galerina marginata CBS 339.88]